MSSETHQQDAGHDINQATAEGQQESAVSKGDAMAKPAISPPSYTEASRDAPVQQHSPQQPMPQQQPMPHQAMPQQPVPNPYPMQQPMNPNAAPVTPLHRLGIGPAWIDCPFCRRRTRTRVDRPESNMTYVLAVLCCCICVFLTCIPCLAHWFANVDHYCSECDKQVTHQPHDGPVEVLSEYGPPTMPSRFAQASDMEMGAGHGQPAGGGDGQQNVLQEPGPAH
ncbi:hypothetical protein KC351_g3942 [Hortaea werneckii]|nr:hypothetical protein KC351_g3942 [Hortaea werneckii]